MPRQRLFVASCISLVTTSIKDMDDFVRSAMDEAVKLPALERKPSDNPGNKPSGSPRG